MAHKKQLGGNKFISKVRVFKPDQGSFPYMVFYVDGPAAPDPSVSPRAWNEMTEEMVKRQGESVEDTGSVKRSDDGKNMLRVHYLRAKH